MQLNYIYFPCMCVLIVVHYMHAVPVEARDDIGSPEIGVTDSCKPPCECWESNLDLV